MRTVSMAKHRKLQQELQAALAQVRTARRDGLIACRADPDGGYWHHRGLAICAYVEARRWVKHYGDRLAGSTPVKGATRHYAGRA